MKGGKTMEENNKDGQKPKEEAKKPEAEKPADDIKKGGKYETTPLIERAREERERMDITVKAMKEENDRRELIMQKHALGGEAEAGQTTEVKEETPKEYSDRVMKNEVKE